MITVTTRLLGAQFFVTNILARMSSASTTLFNENYFDTLSDASVPTSRGASTNQSSYPMMIKFIHESIQGMDLLDLNYEQYNNSNEDSHQSIQIPTMASVLKRDFRKKGTVLDPMQRITYEGICATFLLKLVNNGANSTTTLGQYFSNAMWSVSANNTCQIKGESNLPNVEPDITGATFSEPDDVTDYNVIDFDLYFNCNYEIECASNSTIYDDDCSALRSQAKNISSTPNVTERDRRWREEWLPEVEAFKQRWGAKMVPPDII